MWGRAGGGVKEVKPFFRIQTKVRVTKFHCYLSSQVNLQIRDVLPGVTRTNRRPSLVLQKQRKVILGSENERWEFHLWSRSSSDRLWAGLLYGVSYVKWGEGGLRWEGVEFWQSRLSFAAHAPEHCVEPSVSTHRPPPPPSWIEAPAWCFFTQAPYLRCWHSQLTGGTLIRRAMCEPLYVAALYSAPCEQVKTGTSEI